MQKEAVVDREFRHEEPHTRDELKKKKIRKKNMKKETQSHGQIDTKRTRHVSHRFT